MGLHGLAEVTIGVPDPDGVGAFYRDFGLADRGGGVFATGDGGDQLRLVPRPVRGLVSATVAVDDPDDLDRVAGDAGGAGLAVDRSGGAVAVTEPLTGAGIRYEVRPRLVQEARRPEPHNGPGVTPRVGERSPGIEVDGPTTPRKLGHVVLGTPDIEASVALLTGALGFRLSDLVPGVIAFLRCSTDHHNLALTASPVPFLHHTSWQVDDIDAIGAGAQHLMAVDPARSVWGLGRHFLGSNLFWYFRDPAGNFAEYYADLDQIPADVDWEAGTWAPEKSLYAWGPPVPDTFLRPADLDEIAAAR